MTSQLFTGINIQFPISQLILTGEKRIETRTYPLPDRLIGTKMAIVETPGKTGKFKSRVVGLIVFSGSFKYKNAKEFYADQKRHCVSKDSDWAWQDEKGKWGWVIESVIPLKKTIPLKKRSGIVYSKNIKI
jgi:hypothetical protein